MFVNITLFFISLLILFQCLEIFNTELVEGATGSCELDNDPIYLAKTNASDIKVMKEQVADIKRMRDDMEILKGLVLQNTQGVKQMSDELEKQTSELTGGFEGDMDEIPNPDNFGLE